MSERVTMPALGESVTEGTVTRWLKSVGDRVEVDEPLLEVSTDKVDTEIPSPVAGTLQEILAQEDDTVPVGADLAVIGDGAAPADDDSAPASEAPAAPNGAPTEAPADAPADAPAEAPAETPAEAPAETPPAAPTADAPSTDQPAQAGTSEPESAPAPEAPAAEAPEPGEASAQSAPAAEDTEQDPAAPEADAPSAKASSSDGQTVTMPALGESVTEGTVTRWLKAEGDEVAVDEPLLEVSTDKVDTEIPSPVAGTLTNILAAEDETVPVGGDLAIIGGSATAAAADEPAPAPAAQTAPEDEPAPAPAAQTAPEDAPTPAPDAAQPAPQTAPAAPEAPAAPPSAAATSPAQAAHAAPEAPTEMSEGSGSDAAAYVTPLVRKLATQHGVDLASLKGTGVGGRIRKQDVLDAAEAAKTPEPTAETAATQPAAPAASAPASAPAPVSPKRGTTEKMSRLRKVIAQRMVESLAVSAQLTTVIEVDLTKVARLRDKAKKDFEAREGTKLSYLPFLALAATEALKAHPNVNASVQGDEIAYHGSENLSIAVDTEKGLIVPVIKNAGDLNIAGLARAIADVADRTRNNKITPDDLAGGTFTITNTGSRGALFDTPIINQPQVAILGTGAIVKRPVVATDADGAETLAIRSMMYLALSYDHRIVDGADAARFLGTMKTRLEEGRFEASLGL